MKGTEPVTTPRRRRRDHEAQPPVGTLATVPSAMGDDRHAAETLAIEPTHEDIARRAYQLYEGRGGEHGRDVEDWLQAEREVRQFLDDVGRTILTAEGRYAVA